MKLKTITLLLGVCSASAAFGAITVTPASPTSADTITIRVETPFGSSTNLTSSSISQVGNTFVVQQNVDISCPLPQSTIVASQFQVGPLGAGMYDVTANITFTGFPPSVCSPPPIVQTASFTVLSAVPLLDTRGLFLLAAALGATAIVALKR